MKVVRVLVAVTMGLFSGFLIYMADAMLFIGGAVSAEAILLRGWAVLFGGWAISGALLLWRARTTSQVFKRGFLLGAAEWLGMIAVSTRFSGNQPSLTMARGPLLQPSWPLPVLSDSLSSISWRAKMKPEISGPTERCPTAQPRSGKDAQPNNRVKLTVQAGLIKLSDAGAL